MNTKYCEQNGSTNNATYGEFDTFFYLNPAYKPTIFRDVLQFALSVDFIRFELIQHLVLHNLVRKNTQSIVALVVPSW